MSISIQAGLRSLDAPLQTADRVFTLGRILRSIGVAALIGSATTFLLQRWGVASDVQRYFGLLGLTGALPFLALFCGIGLREGRGARVFLGTLLSIIPVHFGVLGGLIYSQYQWFSTVETIPSYALWESGGPFGALGTTVVAVLLLVPLAGAAFVAMARSHAKALTAVYLLVNSMLLIPTRNAAVVAGLAAVLFVVLLYAELRLFRDQPTLKTMEGIWSRALLPVPLVIMLVRQIHLYSVTNIFGFVVWASLAAGMMVAGSAMEERLRTMLRRSSVLPVALAWWNVVQLAYHSLSLQTGTAILLFGIPLAATIAGLSFLERRNDLFYWIVAGVTAGTAAGSCFVLFRSPLASLCCMGVGVVYMAVGFLKRQMWLLLVGIAGLGSALVYHVHSAIEAYQWSGWAGLALLGVCIIVAASLVERYHGRFSEWGSSEEDTDPRRRAPGAEAM